MKPLSLNVEAVRALLPHRAPLLLVDGVDGISTDPDALRAHKLITATEPVFAGHFPDRPIWPAVYTIEGLAQTCALLGALQAKERGASGAPLSAVLAATNIKFTAPVSPGDRLDYFVQATFRFSALHRFDVEATVAGRSVSKGTITIVVTAN